MKQMGMEIGVGVVLTNIAFVKANIFWLGASKFKHSFKYHESVTCKW